MLPPGSLKERWLASSVALLWCATLASPAAFCKERVVDKLSEGITPTKKIVYKTIGKEQLHLDVFEPANYRSTDKRACIVIFPGGGWTRLFYQECYVLAQRLADKGMVGICVEYRVIDKKRGSNVFDCVKDGRSAMRYIRGNAKKLGIDPERIVVSGFSAGGHVAVGTALFDSVNDARDDQEISPRPNALVLYYPVIDTSKEGYGQQKIGPRWKELSPAHQVKAGVPPTILFQGTADTVTPCAGARSFQKEMELHGNQSELITHEGGNHGYLIFDLKLFEETMQRTESFLKKNGFLERRTNIRNQSSLTPR